MKTALLFALDVYKLVLASSVLGALFASGKVIITKSDQRVTMACGISAFTKRLEWHRENVLVIETFMRGHLPVSRRGQTAIADRSSLVGMSLSVSKVKQEDAGTFTCKADGKSQQHTLVVVSVLVSPSSPVELGSEATLQCRAAGLPSQGTVQWIRPDESPGPKSQNHTLTSVDRSDAGTWKCKVSDSGEEFTYNLELKITEPVRVTTAAPPKNPADTSKSPCSTCVSHGPPHSDQLLGLSWWMWVIIGGGCLIVVLLMVLVICLCKKIKRKKRKLRMQKIQNGRQPRQYCQCNRPTAAAKPQQGRRREKPSALPLQPLLLE